MKKYPKVPRYNHPVVDDEFFEVDDLYRMEKLDGSNFRFFMYDSRFQSEYTTKIQNEYKYGDVIIGLKSTIRGKLSDNIDSFDAVLTNIIEYLRENLQISKIKSLHKKYDSPLLFFGEYMTPNIIDYDYDSNPPPSFIGFDILQLSKSQKTPSNPYNEKFKGFLPIKQADRVFKEIGLIISPYEKIEPPLIIDELSVPLSNFAPVQAEGFIIRSDSLNRRVKYRTDAFKEQSKNVWGITEDEAKTGEELIIARFVTHSRIQKQIVKLYNEKNIELSIKNITKNVLIDVFQEEFEEIQKLNKDVDNNKLFEKTEKLSKNVLNKIEKTAALNNTTIDNVWVDFTDKSKTTNQTINTKLKFDNTKNLEKQLIQKFITEEEINKIIEEHCEQKNKTPGRWLIEPINEKIQSKIWFENSISLLSLNQKYNPAKINKESIQYIRKQIEKRDDVNVDEKPETWEPKSMNIEKNSLSLFD